MYYDYPEDGFYPESEYQEQIDALKEAIKNSVKSEILEEMNRLRAENEKLQAIKEHFEEVKKDYAKKKNSASSKAGAHAIKILLSGGNMARMKIEIKTPYFTKEYEIPEEKLGGVLRLMEEFASAEYPDESGYNEPFISDEEMPFENEEVSEKKRYSGFLIVEGGRNGRSCND